MSPYPPKPNRAAWPLARERWRIERNIREVAGVMLKDFAKSGVRDQVTLKTITLGALLALWSVCVRNGYIDTAADLERARQELSRYSPLAHLQRESNQEMANAIKTWRFG